MTVGIIPFFFMVLNKSKAVLQFPPFSQALMALEYVISFLATPSSSICLNNSKARFQSLIFSQTLINAL